MTKFAEQPHVLLCVPNTDTRASLAHALRAEGFEHLYEVATGSEAVDALRTEAIDALVTDIPLGSLDGWRLARLVRSGVLPCSEELPIVVVSRSYSEHIAQATAKEYEVNRFLAFEQRHRLPTVLRELLGEGGAPRRATLLVVEDNADTVRIVERVLAGRFDIEVAMDGAAGLAAWQAHRHDLVLLDIMLPHLSGEQVLRAILTERPTQSVVVMTADSSPEHAGRLVLAGAADFIAKPFRAEQLRRVCDIAARREDYLKTNEQFALQLNALDTERERALVTLESIGDGVITTDTQGRIEYLNPVAERLTGWTTQAAQGQPVEEVFRLVHDYSRLPVTGLVRRCLDEGRTIELSNRVLLISHGGAEFTVDDSVAPIKGRDGQVVGVVIVFQDVSEANRLNRQLTYQATHDSLTGLINRVEFEQVLGRLLADSRDNGGEHVLFYLDLDQFKVVNDTCGHMAGDQLLQQVAETFKHHIRKRDRLARLGGDEFGVLLEDCTLDKALEVAEGLRASLRDFRFVWEQSLFTVGVSIGVVPINPQSAGLEALLSTADAACYMAKESGRNRIQIYRADDGELVRRYGEMQWVSKITRALEEDRFALYYQRIAPVLGEDDGANYEILVRMIDERGAIVPPGAFLPAAERYDLAPALDRWVLARTLEWLSRHPECLARLKRCAINLSGRSLGDEQFHRFAMEQVIATTVPPEKICFEVTETAVITNLARATEFIDIFKQHGCRFALDDFGSGMSSFAYLKHLPVDFLKIDGAFVKGIADDPIDFAMVRSINEIGHVMGLKTIAEFVENNRILAKLRGIGVDYAQGYGIAKPRPLDDLAEECRLNWAAYCVV